jgi:hypothetical protein
MRQREGSGQEEIRLMGTLSSTIFYQIQHTCDLTLGQGYSTSAQRSKSNCGKQFGQAD